MLVRNIDSIACVFFFTVLCTASAFAQVAEFDPGTVSDPGTGSEPGTASDPGTGSDPGTEDAVSSPELTPLGCYIADRRESCLGKFGPQQVVACPGCNPDNTTCPSGSSYKIPRSSISDASWAKDRAASVKPSVSGYGTGSNAAVLCGKVGLCTTKCRTELINGVTFRSCPKVIDSEVGVRIDYLNLTIQCPAPPADPTESSIEGEMPPGA